MKKIFLLPIFIVSLFIGLNNNDKVYAMPPIYDVEATNWSVNPFIQYGNVMAYQKGELKLYVLEFKIIELQTPGYVFGDNHDGTFILDSYNGFEIEYGNTVQNSQRYHISHTYEPTSQNPNQSAVDLTLSINVNHLLGWLDDNYGHGLRDWERDDLKPGGDISTGNILRYIENHFMFTYAFTMEQSEKVAFNSGRSEGLQQGRQEGYDMAYDEFELELEQRYWDGYYDSMDIEGQRQFDRGKEAGIEEGKDIGYDTGYEAGIEANNDAVFNEGHSIGYNEGVIDGASMGEDSAYQLGYTEGANNSFLSNFDTWIVPAIIVVMFVGGFFAVVRGKRDGVY